MFVIECIALISLLKKTLITFSLYPHTILNLHNLQLPLIMSSKVKGFAGFIISNVGFFISFCILLLVAVFEEKLDSAFTNKFG